MEKDIRKTRKQVRRLSPKVQKAANNYNRILKTKEQGEQLIEAMTQKRDQLLLEFQSEYN